MPRTNNKQIKGKDKELIKENKEFKEKLETQEQRIAELEYKNEAQLFITRLMTEKVINDIRDGMDVKDCIPVPDFDSYKRMVEEILQGEETTSEEYNKEKKSSDNRRTWQEITDKNPEFSDGSSTKEYLLEVFNEVFDFEVNKIGELSSHHKTMMLNDHMYDEYLKWKELKLHPRRDQQPMHDE